MRVLMLKTETVVLDSINSKNYPAEWKGEVDDALANAWIGKGSAVPLADDASKPVELTDQEKAVLKAAAQQAIAAAQGGAGETVDPETGEITGGDNEPSDAEVLASMTFAEVKALAKQKGVKYTARKRADIEADILAVLAAEDEAGA